MSAPQRMSSKMKNSFSGPKYAVSAMPVRLQVGLGALGERTRVALVALHGARARRCRSAGSGWFVEERVHDRGGGVRHQDHVGFVDALPAGDRRTVEHLAVFEEALVDDAAGTVTCCSLPLVSVKRRSTYLTSFSLMIFRTSAAVVMGTPCGCSEGGCWVARRDDPGGFELGPNGLQEVCQRTVMARHRGNAGRARPPS